MAWTFVGSGGNASDSANSLAVTPSTGPSEGDLVVAFAHWNGSGQAISATQGTGAAWTEDEADIDVTNETATYSVFSKTANGTEPSSFTFTCGATDRCGAVVFVFSPDASTTTSLDVSGGHERMSTAQTYVDLSSITVSDDSVAIAFVGYDRLHNFDSPAADNSYIGEENANDNNVGQLTSGSYRIFNTGASTGAVRTSGFTDSDNGYGVHIAYKFTSGGTTLTPAAGTIHLAGQTPLLEVIKTLGPAAGLAHLVGLTPGVTAETHLAPTAGLMHLLGLTPEVQAETTLSPTAGTIHLTGLTPTVTTESPDATTVSPLVGTMHLTGLAPLLGKEVTLQIGADGVGVLHFVGLAPTVGIPVEIDVPSGAGAGRWPDVEARVLANNEVVMALIREFLKKVH